jgi:hypothetical protein
MRFPAAGRAVAAESGQVDHAPKMNQISHNIQNARPRLIRPKPDPSDKSCHASKDDLFASWEPDPAGQILGTGMQRFTTAIGVDGLATVNADRLDILAVVSVWPGKGHFRNFIDQCKKRFNVICVWEVWNPQLVAALGRYGFTPETDIAPWGETVKGYRWDEK